LVLLLRLRQVCSHASLIQEDCSAFTHADDMNLKPDLAKEVTRARRVVSSDFVDRMKAKFKQTALYRIEAEKNVSVSVPLPTILLAWMLTFFLLLSPKILSSRMKSVPSAMIS
jgi:hypothetical protein